MERAATAAPAKEAARLGPVVLVPVPADDPALLVAPEVSADLVPTRVTSRARAATDTRTFRPVTTSPGPGVRASVAGRRVRGVPAAWLVSARSGRTVARRGTVPRVTGRSGRTVARTATGRSVRPVSVAPGRSGVRRAIARIGRAVTARSGRTDARRGTVPRVIGRSGRTVARRATVRPVTAPSGMTTVRSARRVSAVPGRSGVRRGIGRSGRAAIGVPGRSVVRRAVAPSGPARVTSGRPRTAVRRSRRRRSCPSGWIRATSTPRCAVR
jgi:hypothetical protein